MVAAGSLLEIALHEKNISFPVGRVAHYFMHPLTFREFLAAANSLTALKAFDTVPLPTYAYEPLMRHFHKYALIGGMPEVVAAYLLQNDVAALTPIYDSLAVSYQDDAAKYARNPTMAEIIRHCIESVPFSTGKRIVFSGFGQSNYRSREVGEALRTLQRAMLIRLIHPSTSVDIPVAPDMKKSPRLQFLDTGMLNYFVGLQEQYFLHDNLHAFYRGLLAEHIVGQELVAIETNSRKKQCFWVREKSQSMAEVDFIVQHKGHVIPVEVKSGKAGRLKSLHLFMDKCPHRFAIRLYAGPLGIHPIVTPKGKSFNLLNLPYFLASAIHRYIDWMMA